MLTRQPDQLLITDDVVKNGDNYSVIINAVAIPIAFSPNPSDAVHQRKSLEPLIQHTKMRAKGYRWFCQPVNGSIEPLYAKDMKQVTVVLTDWPKLRFNILPIAK